MKIRSVADAVAVHVARFLVMWLTLEVAAWAGITGWYRGFVVNIVVTVFAVVLMTRRGLWRSTGMTTRWQSWTGLVALAPLTLEAISWCLPAGLKAQEPGFALWALSLLLVGANEEMISRGVVLSRLRTSFSSLPAVAITGALFGLQHLSAFALTGREAGDILGNVGLSAVVGFAYAAFQNRFHWLWPLMLLHATADFTTILAARDLPVGWIATAHILLAGFGLLLVCTSPGHDRSSPGTTRTLRWNA